ncbi:MAG: DUF5722 domain-containing protein [Planctomycetota bacterium]
MTLDGPLAAKPPKEDSIAVSVAEHAVTSGVQINTSNGEVVLITTNSDPYLWFELPPVPDDGRRWMLAFEYFSPQGIRGLQWRWGKPPSPKRTADLPPLAPAEGWTTYSFNLTDLGSVRSSGPLPVRLDLGTTADVRLRLRSLIVRPMSQRELELDRDRERLRRTKAALQRDIVSYIRHDWPAAIESLTQDGDRVRLSTRWLSEAPVSPVYAIQRARFAPSAAAITEEELATRQVITFGDDRRAVSDFTRSDALRWQLVREVDHGFEPVSPARYPEPAHNLEPAASLEAAVQRGQRVGVADPKSDDRQIAKGLTCITTRFSDAVLDELGLGHASINVTMQGLLRRESAPGYEAVEIAGKEWYADTHRLRVLDANAQTAFRAAGQVAGILLVQKSGSQFGELAHPESDVAGTYAMPDLTRASAVELYQATLTLLGERYGSRSKIATIDHWIVHNEVDYGWQWTNMGKQPMEVFLDHYIRSMRLVDQAMRPHNSKSKVFISLTHRWNRNDNQLWKTYAPRDMLEHLVELSRLEGDFPWGVAFHPYPQSLWESAVWDDDLVSDDFETPLITIKNLEVLDRFLHLPKCLDDRGAVRPVLCSEQGFHADETDAAALDRQCAALLYTWQKLRQCPSVIAFDYHRPVDHPNEGGLRLGLRGLPSKANRLGEAKPAWRVYRALGTDQEASLRDRYRDAWGQTD